MLELILISTLIISLIAFIGALTISINKKIFDKLLMALVALSAGALMGAAFIHLMPEAINESSTELVLEFALIGFVSFFFIEKIFYWRHCHKNKCDIHTFAYMNLIGESVHNFIDGLLIAVSYMVNIPLGIATTIAVAMHEVPQELGDFGVLVYGGFTKKKALMINFLIGLLCVAGGLTGYYLSSNIEGLTIPLIAITAGGFIYISASDLIPEIRKESKAVKSIITFLVFIAGILIMTLLKH
jgi:zinc and cadmium transporter